jgi:hypothetical protein
MTTDPAAVAAVVVWLAAIHLAFAPPRWLRCLHRRYKGPHDR